MSTKFFTNEEGRTLIEKIEGIFEHKNIHFLDILVGYFRASGYFRIRPFIQRSGKIRILVGINIDRLVQEAWDKGLQFGANPVATRSEFLSELQRNIQKSAYDRTVEEGMVGLVSDITSGKVEIRIHPSQTIHAKIYIFREEIKHPHGYPRQAPRHCRRGRAGRPGRPPARAAPQPASAGNHHLRVVRLGFPPCLLPFPSSSSLPAPTTPGLSPS